jgi:5'(3')-deoxyribonucleotidase
LGWTFDGVIANFSGKFVELANRRFGTDFIELDQTDWDFKPWFSKAQVDEVWALDINKEKNFWLTLKPLPGTSELKSAVDRAELFFITSRTTTAGMSPREQTCWWLRNHFYITYPNVIVVENPSQKIPILKALEVPCMIDDKGSTIRQVHNAGLRSYAKLSPYNCAEPFEAGIVPVETLNQFLEAELK